MKFVCHEILVVTSAYVRTPVRTDSCGGRGEFQDNPMGGGEIYIICRPGGPYWEKLCQRSWVRPEAAGRGPCSRPRAQFFSIRTDQGRQTIFLFFSCCFSKVKRNLLFSESNVLQARVKWTMKRSRLRHQSSKIRFFTLLKLRNHRKQYN